MAWSRGPGELSSVEVNNVSVDGGLIEGFNTETTPDTFSTALGFEAERTSMLKRWTFNNFDYSTVAGMLTLMTARTQVDVEANYVDSPKQTLADAVIRVKPIISPTPSSCRAYILAPPANYNSLASAFDDLGPIIGQPTYTFDWPWEGTDGCGRPYFSSCRITAEFMLPGDGSVTDPYATLSTGNGSGTYYGTKTDVAILMPSGNFLVLADVYCYFHYANEDASMPRAVRVKLVGVASSWAGLIYYTDGGVSATTTAWGTDGAVDPGDLYAGCEVEAVGYGLAEANVVSWP